MTSSRETPIDRWMGWNSPTAGAKDKGAEEGGGRCQGSGRQHGRRELLHGQAEEAHGDGSDRERQQR